MTFTTRRTRGAALALTGLLALGACGSSDESGSNDSSTSSSQGSGSGEGAKSDVAKGDKADAGEVAGRMAAAMQKAGSGVMTMQTGSETATSDFRYVDGAMEQHTIIPAEGQEMEIIAVGDFVYLKGLPEQSTPWVKIDPKADDPVSQMFKNVTGGGTTDPAKLAENLKGTEATVTAAGDETSYEFTVDPAKALGQAAPTPSPGASTPPLTMTLTLDKDDRPVSTVSKAAGQEVKVSYSDWGKKVDIAEPPADQVGPMTFPSAS